MGSVGQNSTFSEHGHVAYQSQMEITNAATWLRKYFSCRPPMTLGFKMQLIQNMVMLHNKLQGMERRAPCMHIFSPHIHPQPVGSDLKIAISIVSLPLICMDHDLIVIFKLNFKFVDIKIS